MGAVTHNPPNIDSIIESPYSPNTTYTIYYPSNIVLLHVYKIIPPTNIQHRLLRNSYNNIYNTSCISTVVSLAKSADHIVWPIITWLVLDRVLTYVEYRGLIALNSVLVPYYDRRGTNLLKRQVNMAAFTAEI